MDWKFAFNPGEQLQSNDRTERHEFRLKKLCVVGKQRRTKKCREGVQYLFVN